VAQHADGATLIGAFDLWSSNQKMASGNATPVSYAGVLPAQQKTQAGD
jgi:hypothetical protein